MRLIMGHRSPSPAAARLIGAVAALLSLQLLSPRGAQAVQVFIDSAYVHQVNPECVVQNTASGVPRFQCPPFTDQLCQAVAPAAKCSTGASPCCPDACNTCGAGGSSLLDTQAQGDASINPLWQGATVGWGNLSNNPRIDSETPGAVNNCVLPAANLIPDGTVLNNVCNYQLYLCASVGYGNTDDGTSSTDIAVDSLEFEIFKFQNGSNPLDPSSTPPQRTFFVDSPGYLVGDCTSDTPAGTVVQTGSGTTEECEGPLGPFCVLWDGSINLNGTFGKTNGEYGFRATVQTNQVGESGNITITAVRAYPSGATNSGDTASCGVDGCIVSQQPITVDVTDIHVVTSSPTTVGVLSPVPVQPYLFQYRLSKDATMYIDIEDPTSGDILRHVLQGVPRVGEGAPEGTLANGDSWNGRADNGDIMAPGVYIARFHANAVDQYGSDPDNPSTCVYGQNGTTTNDGCDHSADTTLQVGLDPLQSTDIRVQPLLQGSTSLAVISYQLSEAATAYIDIYPPGTQFCGDANGDGINALNVNTQIADNANYFTQGGPPKNFIPTLSGSCQTPVPISPLRSIVSQEVSRTPVTMFWNGTDNNNNLVADGDYVFVLYASLPSQNGFAFNGNQADKRIWTSVAKSGFIPVSRGYVGISQLSIASTVIGSSPPVAGLNPFSFSYSLSRDANVSLKIYTANGQNLVKTLVNNQVRPGLFGNVETWTNGLDDNGLIVASGTYLAELTATDPVFTNMVSTTSAFFSMNLFRITDVNATPLLSNTSAVALISYQFSQPMVMGFNVYPPGTIIQSSTSTWPPCASQGPAPTMPCSQIVTAQGGPATPVFQLTGLRVGRLKITDQWDGRDPNGLLVPDGAYPFYLAAQSTQTAEGGIVPFASDQIQGTINIQRGQIVFTEYQVNPTLAQLFESSDTIPLDPFSINYVLTRESSVTIQILNVSNPPTVIRTLFAGQVREGNIALTDVWDGRDDYGNFPPEGFYNVRAIATDVAAQESNLSVSTAQTTISYDPLQIYDVAVTPVQLGSAGSRILYQVSEPMKVSIKIYAPGTSFDLSGNPTPPESQSLVKRIVQVQDPRRQVESDWDGTNLQQALVPDGTYRFRIVASTDINAIDTLTGNVIAPTELADGTLIDDIPVVRNGSLNPQGDFETNSFAYPNPANGPNVTFELYQPEQGVTTLRIYNIAGTLILENDFPESPPSYSAGPITWVWNKTNAFGKPVGRGVYFAVLHFESTLGGKEVLQTVKKLLLP